MSRVSLSTIEDRTLTVPFIEGWLRDHVRDTRARVATKIVYIVAAFTALGLVIGSALSLLSPDADAAPASSTAAASTPVAGDTSARECPPGHEKCIPANRWAVDKFKDGKMGRHNFKPSEIYPAPKKAARAWKAKIRKAVNAKYGKAAARLDLPSAGQMYRTWVRRSDCVGSGGYHPYTTGYQLCDSPEPVTVEDIQKTGTVILCGAGVVAGFLGTAPTGGISASVGIGAASCLWGAWITFSED